MTPEQTKAFEEKIYAYIGRDFGPPQRGRDDVNAAMIRQWAEIMGDDLPTYYDEQAAAATSKGGIIAPPTMLQAWILAGYPMAGEMPPDAQVELHEVFNAHGYTGVLGTDSSYEFFRDVRPGDQVIASSVIESISEQKATARGIGYFVTTVANFTNQHGDALGRQVFRVLKFIPADGANDATGGAHDDGMPAQPTRIPAPRGHDNGWWWQACDEGKVLIQRCKSCQTLRHPPRPMCGECQSIEWDAVESSLDGEVFSYVVMHYPKVPGYPYPLVCAVISLDEGTRIVSNVVGIEPEQVHIGMRVKGKVEQVDEKTMLPQFYPA